MPNGGLYGEYHKKEYTEQELESDKQSVNHINDNDSFNKKINECNKIIGYYIALRGYTFKKQEEFKIKSQKLTDEYGPETK